MNTSSPTTKERTMSEYMPKMAARRRRQQPTEFAVSVDDGDTLVVGFRSEAAAAGFAQLAGGEVWPLLDDRTMGFDRQSYIRQDMTIDLADYLERIA
jgi:hypothetical protein